jgi:hypothetical protein
LVNQQLLVLRQTRKMAPIAHEEQRTGVVGLIEGPGAGEQQTVETATAGDSSSAFIIGPTGP